MNLFKRIMAHFFDTKIKVIKNERLSPHFQFITIKGSELKNSDWIAGDKVKIAVNSTESRSYTPCSWNNTDGVLETLVYMHALGPGALWARDVRPKTAIKLKGPTTSLLIKPESEVVILFGDETTIGLAHALKKSSPHRDFHFFFEFSDVSESESILKKFELESAAIFSLNQCEIIAEKITMIFNDLKTKNIQITLSGKQQSIVALRELLYQHDIPNEIIGTKVYWGWKDDPNGKLKK